MFMIFLTFLTALAIAAVAGWFSIVGIMTIFAGAKVAALIMGAVLEAGKLMSASWLYRNWSGPSLLLRAPLVFFTIVLMFITSMGIFGFLSKAHIEQGASTGNNSAKVERLDEKINQEKLKITEFEKQISQLDEAVDRYAGRNKVTQSVSLRRSQQNERDVLSKNIDDVRSKIDQYTDEKFSLQTEIRSYELEVGPIKYIAALIYDDPKNNLESAVRIVTLIIVAVFDPFAVILLIAANYSLINITKKNINTIDEKEECDQGSIHIPPNKWPISSNMSSKKHTPTSVVKADNNTKGKDNVESSPKIPVEVPKKNLEVVDEKEESKVNVDDLGKTDVLGVHSSTDVKEESMHTNSDPVVGEITDGAAQLPSEEVEEILDEVEELNSALQYNTKSDLHNPLSNTVNLEQEVVDIVTSHPLLDYNEAEIIKRKSLYGFSPKSVQEKSKPKVSGWMDTDIKRG